MVLLHGGSPNGAERIAARWADTAKYRKSLSNPLRPVATKAAPFKRNDQILEVLPIGVIVFPDGHPGEPRRQGTKARHPGLALRLGRRVSAAIFAQSVTRLLEAHVRVSLGAYCTRRRSCSAAAGRTARERE